MFGVNKLFLGATKHLLKRVCLSVRPSVRSSVRPSVGPFRLLIFGGFDLLWSTAWPVLALHRSRCTVV